MNRTRAITSVVVLTFLFAADVRADQSTPLMSILDRFTAPGVPELGPAESPVAPRKPSTRPAPANLPGKGLAQHPMLYIGEGYNKMFLVNGGKIIWTYSTGKGNEYDDVWMLSNGNILFTRMQYIAEVTPDKKEVWHYDAPKGTEIHCCQPIGLEKVLFVENGLPPKLKVMNIRTGTVEVSHDLDYLQPPDPKKVHPQFRRVRYTAQGTYLVPYLNMNKVVEYDKDFKEIWTYKIKSPWAAIRLKNGNTLITDESDKLTIEVNPKGESVWQLKPDDLPAEYRFVNTQTCTRLANGNTIICSRGNNGAGPQLVEVTPEKKGRVGAVGLCDAGPGHRGADPRRPGDSGESGGVGALGTVREVLVSPRLEEERFSSR